MIDSAGGFAPRPTVVARLTARAPPCHPPEQGQDCGGKAAARTARHIERAW